MVRIAQFIGGVLGIINIVNYYTINSVIIGYIAVPGKLIELYSGKFKLSSTFTPISGR